MSKLTESDRELIARNLPPEIAALAERYPSDVLNAAIWRSKSLPSTFKTVEFWYGDSNDTNPDIIISDGILRFWMERPDGYNPPVCALQLDSKWVFIEIEGKIALDRLNEITLPPIVSDPTLLLSGLLKLRSS